MRQDLCTCTVYQSWLNPDMYAELTHIQLLVTFVVLVQTLRVQLEDESSTSTAASLRWQDEAASTSASQERCRELAGEALLLDMSMQITAHRKCNAYFVTACYCWYMLCIASLWQCPPLAAMAVLAA